jgi:hypothetical protein
LITPEEVAKDNGYRQVAEEFAYAPRFFRRHRRRPKSFRACAAG